MTFTSSRPARGRRAPRLLGAMAATIPLLVPVLVAPPASAHASVLDIDPNDGAVLDRSSAPTSVSVTFDEVVSITSSSLRVRNASGGVLTGAASRTILSGGEEDHSRVSARTRRALPAGRFALEFSVTSQDGHQIARAFGFGVEVSTPASQRKRIRLASSSSGAAPRVVISGTRVGARAIRVRMPAGTTGGQVQLTCNREGDAPAKVSAPFVWRLGATSDGVATARGYLPTPCRYTVTLTLDRPFPADPSSWRTTSPLAITS